MIARIYSAAVRGVDATLVDVEVAFRELPDDPMATSKTLVVGLPDAAVRESIERVNFSLLSCEFLKPKGTHVIN